MKKVLLIFLIFCSILSVKAENEKYYHMPFEIAYFDNWFNDYPVIIGTYGLNFIKGYITSEELDSRAFLYCAITSINGESTQYKNSGEIIDMCMKSDTLQLELCKKASGKKHYFKCDMIQENNRDLPPFDIKYAQSIPFERYTGSYPEEIRVFSSPGIDFSQYNTYDFVITGNDPLEDQAILQTFARQDLFKGMVRDEESPDLIITIAKNADESISATYVPPTSQVVQSGSITTPVYNYITHKHDWVTKNRTSIHKTEGYTQTTKTSNIYLEISILDTKQMLQKGQNTPPIVWQMKFNKTYTNSTMQPIDIYNSILSWSVYPFKSFIYEDTFYLKKSPAAIWDENHIITKVYDNGENSDFLQEGDQILAINGKKELIIKTTAIWDDGNKTPYIRKFRLDEPSGLHRATTYFLFYLSKVYTGTLHLRTELGSTCEETRITNNFGGKRSFTVLRNGKKKTVKGILFPLDDVKEYTDINKSDFNKYFNRFIEGKK
jgi:hypothetical protein